MKGLPGLLIAVALGILGAFCNWFYLAHKARDLEKVEFIGIADNVQINAGDKFKETDLQPVAIPRLNVGNLEQAAPLYSDRATVIGMPATRSYIPGEILLRQDLRTPPPLDIKKLLAENERVMWIPVDTRTFVPTLVNSGDFVSFVVPRTSMTPSEPPRFDATRPPPQPTTPALTETIGPFRVLALGNRLGSPEVLRAAGLSPTQENVMAIAVKTDKSGALDAAGQKLSDALRAANFQHVQVFLHPGNH